MFLRSLAIVVFAASTAQADWTVTELNRDDYPPEVVVETRGDVSLVTGNGLPDGLIAKSWGDIRRAWYEGPTRRYAHGILGDAIEAETLVAYDEKGARHEISLPRHQVFEDRYPRIFDLDGDGLNEIITIRASSTGGGGVAIYGMRDGRLIEVAAIAEIGTPNRWLNIAAIEDLNGDGMMEIAFVKTPHIGGTLRVFGYRNGEVRLLDEMDGFSNHAIGAREMRLSAMMDADGDGTLDVAVPNAARRALRIIALDGESLREIASVEMPRGIASAIMVENDGFVLGLVDGSVWRVAPR